MKRDAVKVLDQLTHGTLTGTADEGRIAGIRKAPKV